MTTRATILHVLVFTGVAALELLAANSAHAGAAPGCRPVGTCTPDAGFTRNCDTTVPGTDANGCPCTVSTLPDTCKPTGSSPTCSDPGPVPGTRQCSSAACTVPALTATCRKPADAPLCGEGTLPSTDTCNQPCDFALTSCNKTFVPFGWALPGHETYGFGIRPPQESDLFGLAAKGNIVIGDYTSSVFQNKVVNGLLDPAVEGSNIRPYVVHESDELIGYTHDPDADCHGGSPCFNGDYTQVDGGLKRDNALPEEEWEERRFYESSLPDAQFQALLDPALDNPNTPLVIDGVLYTNHAIAGMPGKAKEFVINGVMVSRDDAVFYNRTMTINHDQRLVSDVRDRLALSLPMAIKRPRLMNWLERPPPPPTN